MSSFGTDSTLWQIGDDLIVPPIFSEEIPRSLPEEKQLEMSVHRSANPEQHFLEVVDHRTGKKHMIPVEEDTIDASIFAQLGLSVYDNGYLNTAVCRSSISYIDGDKGILRYRGYNIEDLAMHSSFLEVSYLLIFGDLPTADQLNMWTTRIMRHTFIHENMIDYLRSFRYDAHPMGMVTSALAAMSTFHPEANTALQGEHIYQNENMVNKQIFRCLGKVPTLAACAYRHRIGRAYNSPSNEFGYTENFLYMLDRLSENNYVPNPRLSRALDIIFILHADHELNCSTAAMRQMTSTGVDPFICLTGAASALYGPSHGGANEAALKMLEEIGSVDHIPAFIEEVKAKKRRLMGFGHRVYKSYDPRAKILKQIADEVFEIMGRNNLIDVAIELERIALSDEYFIKRNLYPNVDFYSGIIYKAMGFPTDFFPVLFCIARTAGWLAHWHEQLQNPIPIFRPKQAYEGEEPRNYVPIDERVAQESSPLDLQEKYLLRKNLPPMKEERDI
ncbi:citrate (Si)-synthase [Spizellomyces punctatus DAOM BR117]|uniref:Citrate synthase n=1 Tax=Spizellomyces punctatus (strain DAOM BR117) TaxID=645134 RepID=A0A0L0HC24_SPIPD|nr:citrate (Si)-synthase [Spizellomyces punctatus DAOM BR117]KNC98323.1 citrate (Si)-synthase [Spizellomyces punctatus DAOM BR117]|eukprot:XP_016606363.1 citrate (Si)-synthase [Spizellomyces punctatus DAOM BR117]